MSKRRKKPTTKLSLDKLKKNSQIGRKEKSGEKKMEEKIEFPLDVFPKRIQDIINNWHNANQLPIDFYGLGLLTVCGGVIGNAYSLKYKNSQTYSPVIYAIIVGNSSIGKTPVLKLLLSPIYRIESKFQKEYEQRLEEWEFENKDKKKKDFTDKPKRQNILLNDATVEAICQAHQTNLRGLISFNDEIVAWLNSQNRYRNGSDNEFWLSGWSGSSIKVNRVSKDDLYIEKPSIAVLGGIQPSVLKTLVRKDNKVNGFLYRILFAFPEDVKKPYDTDIEIDKFIESDYHEIIKKIFAMEGGVNVIEGFEISMTKEAKDLYRQWKNKLTDETNETDEDSLKSLFGKLESYCLRFALILHVLELVCEKDAASAQGTKVSKSTIEKAIELTAYFKIMGLKVLDKIEINDPFDGLSENFLSCYKNLPEEFKTNEGVKTAGQFKISKRTFQRDLKKKDKLFMQVKHGVYRKLL